MSQIAKTLADVAEVTIKRGEDRQEFLNRAIKAVSDLSDKDWDALGKEAQDWFNAAADAKNAKAKTLPDFPDLEEQEEPKTSRRSSAKDKDEEPKTTGTKEIDVAKVKAKMAVKVVTKRGKEFTGVVAEVDDEVLVLKMGNGDEEEVSVDRIQVVFALDTAGEKDDEPADPIKVGAQVIVTTKRGKEVKGKIVEMDDDVIVLKTDEGEEELDRSRIGAIEVTGGGKVKDDEPAAKTSRRSSAKDEDKDDGKAKRTRSSNEGGVSVGQRIKELIADDLEATEAEIGKKLTKEGLEFRENTLKLNYADAHKFIEILKAKKMLKA